MQLNRTRTQTTTMFLIVTIFKAPKPKNPWAGVLEAKNPGDSCIQLNHGRLEGSEDCLRLNIYSPLVRKLNSYDRFG
jgi:carboxylesterase type B